VPLLPLQDWHSLSLPETAASSSTTASDTASRAAAAANSTVSDAISSTTTPAAVTAQITSSIAVVAVAWLEGVQLLQSITANAVTADRVTVTLGSESSSSSSGNLTARELWSDIAALQRDAADNKLPKSAKQQQRLYNRYRAVHCNRSAQQQQQQQYHTGSLSRCELTKRAFGMSSSHETVSTLAGASTTATAAATAVKREL
jgi:hypothetical protein